MGMRVVPASSRPARTVGRAILCAVLSGAISLGAAALARAQTPYNSITLDWTAPGDDGNVGQVSSYELRYSTTAVAQDTTSWWNGVPSGQRLTLGPPLSAAGDPDSYTVTGLTQGTTYYFVLRALDEVANISGFSNVAVGTTQTCNAPTTAPGQFDAVADTGQVTVTWDTSSIDPLAVSLKLYRGQGTSGPLNLYRTLSPTSSPFVDGSLQSGTTYRYRATWMGSACEGSPTSIVSVTTPGLPPPPPPPADAGGSAIHAYPNPASGSIRLVIDVAGSASQAVVIRLFDMNGHWVATLANGTYPPGPNETIWGRVGRDGQVVVPGYYELLGTVGAARVRERLVLIP